MRERLLDAACDAGTAMVFLTRLPVPWPLPDVEARLARCAPWFPVVGLVVGAIGALAWWVGAVLWGNPLAALLAVAATVLVTGAFHEDGLADTFDGLGGGAERERALEIMKDSRLGAYGTLALALVLAGRVMSLIALGPAAPAALIGGHALARYASLPLIRWLPYARSEGTARPFAGSVSGVGLLGATILTAAATIALWGLDAALAWLACAAVVALVSVWCLRRLGGVTGDTFGAANQFAELAIYLALAV